LPPTQTPKAEAIDVIEVQQGNITLNVLGTSPLICNRMSEKARRELLMPAGRKTTAEKASSLKHDPITEFRASPYFLPDGPTLIGIMSSAFKGAMATAALDLPGATKAKIGRLVYVEGDYCAVYGTPQLHMSIVRSADMNHTPDVRTRAIIPEWAARVSISYVEPVIKLQSVINLLSAAGITAGVGDWRPEKGKGAYGRFTIVNDDHPDFRRLIATGGRNAQEHAMQSPTAYDSETEELLGWYMDTAKAKGFAPAQAVSA
jgi:hypothetical protein